MTKEPLFNQVTIIGLGLIGGSLGLALKRRRISRRVIGFSRRDATVRRAKAWGAVDDGCADLCSEWLGSSDLMVIATPPLAVAKVAGQIARMTSHHFILTDVASTKAGIIRDLEQIVPPRISVVGSHPMAGSEQSGISAARADLFEGAPCIVTKTPRTDRKALSRISALWRGVGGRPIVLTPPLHDELVVQVSHLPHLVAVALLLAASPKALKLSAGGFADLTRVALSDPALWEQIFRTNRQPVARALDRFLTELKSIRALLRTGSASDLRRLLQSARLRRQKIK